jgi:putative transposase
MIAENIICKHCGSNAIVKFGTYEGTQRYWCKSCERKFSADDYLFRMKTPANQVSSALDMYYKGMSIEDICEHLFSEHNNHPSSKTVYEWINKYTDEAIKQFKDYHPKVGDTWVADETVLRINGLNVWMYDIIDEKTRYLLASKIATTRTTEDAQRLMELASKTAGKRPKVVLTDKNNSYLDGIELAYGSDTEHRLGSPFTLAKDENTSLIERFHGTIKERTKVMRGLKSMESALQFLDGFMVYYNYLRPHEKLEGKTPAEEAKIDYKLKTWKDITLNTEPKVEVLTTPAKTVIVSEEETLVRPIEHRTYDYEKKSKQRKLHRKLTKHKSHKSDNPNMVREVRG